MARIDIDNASVSYFLRGTRAGGKHDKLQAGRIGAQILDRGQYLEVNALRNINLHLTDGDRVGLVGTNGSGKSTLLKLCAGALAVQSGSIAIEGKVSPQFSLGSGMRPTLSGRRNTELKCLYLGIPQRSVGARVEEVKILSGLEGYFELPISSYSAGMRSRLVMSMLRLVRGEILIMDEWIGAADVTVNNTLNLLQAALIEQASILVLASHSKAILEQWTTKLLWMERGEIVAFGPTQDLLKDYTQSLAPPAGAKAIAPAKLKSGPAAPVQGRPIPK